MLYSGLDLHKKSCVITTLDTEGRTVQRGKLACDPSALRSYFTRLSGPHTAAVEATGSWYWLADLLGCEGIDLRLAHAKYLKAIAYAKVKTDSVDSATLAQLLRVGLLPEAHMITPELRASRDLLRSRLLLVEKTTSARNSIHRLLEKYNVASPEELPASARLQAGLFTEQILLLRRQIKRLEQEVQKDLLAHPDVQRLLWVPGTASSPRSPSTWKSMAWNASPPSGTSSATAGSCPARPIPPSVRATSGARTATGT